MTDRFVGIGGNDGNSGLTWALRKLTLNGVEDTPVVAGDDVYVGPGVYRELLTVDVSGANPYSAGTVTVTNGSTTITGAGTAFLANVAAAYEFHVRLFASAADGVANGTATLTSAGGNFQASMIGKVIQINVRGSYLIAAVAAANSITLSDPNALGWPGAGGGLTYSVMSGEGHYEIASITDNTNFELVKPWNGPTLTGLAYLTFEPIRYIGDVSGENTDGVGGIVRITGTDDDQATDRTRSIIGSDKDYRTFRGFTFDTTSNHLVQLDTGCKHWILEDCTLFINSAQFFGGIWIDDDMQAITMRRCVYVMAYASYAVTLQDSVVQNDTGCLVENSLFMGRAMLSTRIGGVTFRDNTVIVADGTTVRVAAALTVGQAVVVNNTIFVSCGSPLYAVNVGEIVEDYNTLWANGTNRTNVATGANSETYPPLFTPPILLDGFQFPWWFSELSEWSAVQAIAGIWTPAEDLLGKVRPVTAAKLSWGSLQYTDMERETGTVRTGSVSMAIRDAGRHQIWVPVTNTSTTIKVYVYREANYAGLLPQMIVKQPGQADDVTTDVGAAGGWNLLTTTLVPAAIPPYVVVELVSRNTNGAADEVFFDDLDVS